MEIGEDGWVEDGWGRWMGGILLLRKYLNSS